MADNVELDPRRLTFSQAHGYEPIPTPLALGQLSEVARIKLWNQLVLIPDGPLSSDVVFVGGVDPDWHSVFEVLHVEFWVRPVDEFPLGYRDRAGRSMAPFNIYKDAILNYLPYNKVFDLFQMIMRHPRCPVYFTVEVAAVFKECRLAYVVDIEQPVTILPAVTDQEGEALMGAMGELRQAGLHGAETHLKRAGELINEGEWADAVRESIHSVESVARLLAPDANTLGPALAELERGGRLHPALKEAFNRLYGYTSDEEGIRHPLIENSTSPVGQDEAVFMLGACASFASYLWRRHQSGN